MKSNWSGNITFRAAEFHEPATIEELQLIVSRAKHVRVVGAGHSFNDIVDTDGALVSLRRLNRVVGIDSAASTVSVEGGILHYELAEPLQQAGLALANLPSKPHFSVVGSSATGTHGSGDTNRCLASAIRGLEIVTAEGDLVEIPADDLPATAIGLGAFGAVARVDLEVEPAFSVAQELHLDMPLANAIDHLDEIMASAYSVSYFTDWQHGRIDQVWRKFRLDTETGPLPDTPEDYLGARRASQQLAPGIRPDGPLMPSEREKADRCTEQRLVPGPWHDRLPHVRATVPAQPGTQLQTEYFVSRRHGQDALRAVAELERTLAPVMFGGVMGEIRTVAADDLWLSPFPNDSLALHFSWVNDWPAVGKVLPAIESALQPFEPRPHWGKLHTLPVETVRRLYPRLDEFVAQVGHYDPYGKFRNRHLDRLFG